MSETEISQSDVAVLRSWLDQQDHLPSGNVDDHLIARFLHCTENNVEKSKHIMEHFFKLRAEAPEFFTNRDPLGANIKMVFQIIDIIPLPKLTPEGYKVFLFRLADPDPDKFDYMDYLRTFFNVADTRMKTEKEFPTGEVPLFDMTGFTFKHLMKLNISALRKQMQYVQEAHPVKLKQVHVINTMPILERVMVFLKPLIKKQVAAMLHFHVPNSNTLEKFIPKHILPDEYGGQAGPLKELKQSWITKINSEREWLISNPWHAIDKTEKKKNDKQKLDSSFRSLSID